MEKKTIVHLITGLGGGGAEQMVLKLGMEAQKLDVDTLVVSISNINTLEQKFKDAKVPHCFLGITSVFKVFKGLRELKKRLSDENELVLHCHMFHALMIGLVFQLFYRKLPIVFTLHNTTVERKYRAFLLGFSKIFRKADILFSKSGAQWFLKNSIVIPNGLDISNFEVSKEVRLKQNFDQTFHFLFLGSLTEQKNPLSLVNFASDLLENGISNFVIDVVGDGQMRTQLEEKITNANHQNNIKLHGFSNKVIDFLKSSHCLIMPSHWEGMPVVILEAGAARLPIISTPVGSIPDIISNDKGYLAELKSFSKTMQKVVEDYSMALKKSDIFYSHVVDNYSIQEVFKKHLELYHSV